MAIANATILLVGGGRMGHALWKAWRDNFYDVTIIEIEEQRREFLQHEGAHVVASLEEAKDLSCDMMILAVKPEQLDQCLFKQRDIFDQNFVMVSLAAGVRIARLVSHGRCGLRAMPNLPARVKAGVTALFADERAKSEDKKKIEKLFASCGAVLWLEDEMLMDSVTALSGSGPAYVFYFLESLARAGENLGLSEQDAYLLARQTMVGAMRLIEQEQLTNKDQLCEARLQVTSHQGTTAAAMEILGKEKGGLEALMIDAMRNAHRRSIELREAQ